MALVQVQAPGGQKAQPADTAAAAETSGMTPRWQVVAASFAAISAAWLLSITINAAFKPAAMAVPVGIGLFTVLYAVTQGLERLLQPLSSFFFCTKTATEIRDRALAAAVNMQDAADGMLLPDKLDNLAEAARVAQETQRKPAWHQRASRNRASDGVTRACDRINEALLPAPKPDKQHPELVETKLADGPGKPESEALAIVQRKALELAAATQAELDQRRADKAVAYWALASTLGLLLSATLGMYLLHIVGLRGDGMAANGTWAAGILSGAGIRHMIDLLVTGLAIGGGTKPLHDLVSNLQAAKVRKKDPSQTQ